MDAALWLESMDGRRSAHDSNLHFENIFVFVNQLYLNLGHPEDVCTLVCNGRCRTIFDGVYVYVILNINRSYAFLVAICRDA